MVMVDYSQGLYSERMNYVHYIWILLSILVSVTCSFCFLQPEWIIHPNVRNAFGIYAFCVGDAGSNQFSRTCGLYGGRYGFGNIPCTIWQAACLLYGGGSLFTCFGALCSLTTMCVRKGWDKTLVLATRYLQISSGTYAYYISNIIFFNNISHKLINKLTNKGIVNYLFISKII